MSSRVLALIVIMTTMVATLPAQADIYAYRDEHGVLNFTNMRPNDARYKIRVAYKDKPAVHASVVNYRYTGGDSPMTLPPQLNAIVNRASVDYAVDKSLVQAVIHVESAFDTRAVSAKGASGLMQLMPKTAQRYGVHDLFDPEQNVMGGVQYLRDLLDAFGNNERLALAAYNAGENSVAHYGGVPPFPETVNYVDRVLKLQDAYRDF